MTFGEFKVKHPGAECYLRAAEDIPGFYRQGRSIYGNCDDMEIVSACHNTDTNRWSLWLKEVK